MSDKTGISWTDATWNPIRGCSRVSEGCRNCYAETVAARFSGPGQAYEGLADRARAGSKWTGAVRFITEHLADPLRWTKPRRIFVNSMSDLFHEELTNKQIAAIVGVMAACPQHTFQVLTKRADRMRAWFAWLDGEYRDRHAKYEADEDERRALVESNGYHGHPERPSTWHARLLFEIASRCVDNARFVERPWRPWPLPNVWLGVSVEDQKAADTRIPDLLATPAAVRFLSCEPLLGQVILPIVHVFGPQPKWTGPRIDWVIAGCESGTEARICSVDWLRSLRDQCAAADVPFFLKQATRAGSAAVGGPLITLGKGSREKRGTLIELPYLEGVQHVAFPSEGRRG